MNTENLNNDGVITDVTVDKATEVMTDTTSVSMDEGIDIVTNSDPVSTTESVTDSIPVSTNESATDSIPVSTNESVDNAVAEVMNPNIIEPDATDDLPKKKSGRKKKVDPDSDADQSEVAGDENSEKSKSPRQRKQTVDTADTPKRRGRKKKIDTLPDEPVQIDVFIYSDILDESEKADVAQESTKAVTESDDNVVIADAVSFADDVALAEGIEVPDTPVFNEEGAELDILGDPIPEDVDDVIIEEDTPKVYMPRPLTKKEPKYNEENPRRVDFLFDFIELFIFTLVTVLVITTFFVRHSVVDGTSMDNTLHDGDVLIISDFLYSPTHGDIVVVQDTSTALPKPIVKRIIGISGDVIRVAREGIYRNGELLEEPYVYTDNLNFTYHKLPADEIFNYPGFSIKFEEKDGKHLLLYYEFVVPEGEMFVMGDHRNVSTDSRDIGTVKEDAIIGHVLFRLFPFDVFGAVN